MYMPAFIRSRYAQLTTQQKRLASLISTVICTLLIIVGCQALSNKKKPYDPIFIRHDHEIIVPDNSPLQQHLVIAAVGVSNCPHMLTFPGMIEANPNQTISILPPATGRIIHLYTHLGDFVKPDQPLLEMGSPDMAQAYADQEKAQSAMNLITAALARAVKDYQAGGISQADLQATQNTYAQAAAELKRANERLVIMDNSSNRLTIRAPLAGQVSQLNYAQGAYVNDLLNPILIINNIKSLYVSVAIPENYIRYVTIGQKARLTTAAYPEESIESKVSFINPLLDPNTRRIHVYLLIDNLLDKYLPNMFATAHIAVQQPNQPIIPLSAVVMNNDSTSVYLETSPWHFIRRQVLLGNEEQEHVHISHGLKPGDRIVVSGGVFIND